MLSPISSLQYSHPPHCPSVYNFSIVLIAFQLFFFLSPLVLSELRFVFSRRSSRSWSLSRESASRSLECFPRCWFSLALLFLALPDLLLLTKDGVCSISWQFLLALDEVRSSEKRLCWNSSGPVSSTLGIQIPWYKIGPSGVLVVRFPDLSNGIWRCEMTL